MTPDHHVVATDDAPRLRHEAAAGSTSPPTGTMPMPDIKSVFLGGLFIMALLATCSIAAEIIMPTVLAFILKLVLQPLMRVLAKLRLPRGLAAALIIVLVFGGFFGMGSALSTSAAGWIKQFSDSLPRLHQRLHFVMEPVMTAQGILHNADGLTQSVGGPKPVTVAVEGSRLSDRLLNHTQSFLTGMGQTVLVAFFLLIAGDTFLRRLVEVLPRFKDKRHAVEISQKIESDISAYLATITVMNVGVGFAAGLTMIFCKIGDPVLWGTVAFFLNYIPIIGPIAGIVMFGAVGLISINGLLPALLPAGIYLVIHLAESLWITPRFLARRFTLNPVIVMLALIFWYWMWGVPGAILSTPMLAITKIVCDHIPSLKPVGHFLEGETRNELTVTAV